LETLNVASAEFWVALLSAFLILKWIAEAGMSLDALRVRTERRTGHRGASEATPELRKAA
jgi:hypothetical protein